MLVNRASPRRSRWKAVLACAAGVSAVEFALMAPVLISVVLGLAEYSHYTTVSRRAEMAAHSMALSLGQFGGDPLSEDDTRLLSEIWAAVNPTADDGRAVGSDLPRNVAVSLSSIVFDPITPPQDCNSEYSACAFQARTEWIYVDNAGVAGADLRNCDTRVVNNRRASSGSTIPVGIVSETPTVAVDLAFQYEPRFAGGIVPSTVIRTTVFQSTRKGVPLRFENRNSRAYTECPR